MKKSTKGSIAAGAAGVLLLGGAGSVAYWTASGDAAGGSITAGTLTMTDLTCAANWTEGGATVALIVPGDTVTKVCTGNITMTGNHISAAVALDDASVATAEAAFNNAPGTPPPATSGDAVDISAALTGGGTVSASGPISVTLTVAWPYGTVADNDAQAVSTSALNNLVVTAVQADPHPSLP